MIDAILSASAFTLGMIIGSAAGGLVGLMLGIFIRSAPRDRETPGGDQITDPVP